jgi:hypothetical protein
MPSLPPLTFEGTKAIFDMGGGQKVYLEVTTLSVKEIITDVNHPFIEQFTMIHRWLTQRDYTLFSLSKDAAERADYANATYSITLSA